MVGTGGGPDGSGERARSARASSSGGGAPSPWREFHQLFLASLNAQSAFAVAEQLALAVGLKEMAEETFAIENEQAKYHLLIQELLLETASLAILYKAHV